MKMHMRTALLSAAVLVFGAASNSVAAQNALPSTVTPKSFAPVKTYKPQTLEISAAAALQPPQGSDKVYLTASKLEIQGGFKELESVNEEAKRLIEGKRLSLTEIFGVAALLEKAYAKAGYLLVRVTLPPQRLQDGGTVKFAVVDGFFEEIEMKDVPVRVRKPVLERTRKLLNKRHVTMNEVSRAVLLAGDVAGITLRSALYRGKKTDGVILKLEGEHRLLNKSISFDNQLSDQLSNYQAHAKVNVNSALGMGEIAYASVSEGMGNGVQQFADFDELPLLVIGGGLVMPIGGSGFTVNPEATYSKSRPVSSSGTKAEGIYKRYSLRGSYPLIRTRATSMVLTGSVEYQSQLSTLLATDQRISKDEYAATRVSFDWQHFVASGRSYHFMGEVSQGLGGRDPSQSNTVPLSHNGASPDFTKLMSQVGFYQRLGRDFEFNLSGSAQYSFEDPMMTSEQLSLDGADALSGMPSSSMTTDAGAVLRGEFGRSVYFDMSQVALDLQLRPYVFAAGGVGKVYNATAVEESDPHAVAFGGGVRVNMDSKTGIPGASVGFEFGQAYSNMPGESKNSRFNVSGSFSF